jgi:hypothetical protein
MRSNFRPARSSLGFDVRVALGDGTIAQILTASTTGEAGLETLGRLGIDYAP